MHFRDAYQHSSIHMDPVFWEAVQPGSVHDRPHSFLRDRRPLSLREKQLRSWHNFFSVCIFPPLSYSYPEMPS